MIQGSTPRTAISPPHGRGSLVAARAVGVWLALAATIAPSVGAQPPQFSGATCSMTNCDCNCIAAEEQRGDAAIESLRIDLSSPLIRTPTNMSPATALAHLQRQRMYGGLVRFMMNAAAQTRDPKMAEAAQDSWNHFQRDLPSLELPPVPAGWTPTQYVDNMMTAGKPVIDRAARAVNDERAVRREISDCRKFADLKQCDPSLGMAGEKSALLPAPPRTMGSTPTAETPSRQRPPDGPQPFERTADGKPRVTQELVTRFVLAKKAKDLEGGGYWRRGQFGQADYAEVEQRFSEWWRTKDSPEKFSLFDNIEIGVLQVNADILRRAFEIDWAIG